MDGLTKEDVLSIRVNTNIFVIKNAIRVAEKLAKRMNISFQEFLSFKGYGNQKYSKVDIEKANFWKTLSNSEKDLIAEWYTINGSEKRQLIQDILAIKTDAEIDKAVIKFETLANYFSPYWENKSFDNLEAIAQDFLSKDKNLESSSLIIKLSEIIYSEVSSSDDNNLGEFFEEFIKVLELATKKDRNVLIYTSIELLVELFIRIFAKSQVEVDESFFVYRIVKKLVEILNLFDFTKIDN